MLRRSLSVILSAEKGRAALVIFSFRENQQQIPSYTDRMGNTWPKWAGRMLAFVPKIELGHLLAGEQFGARTFKAIAPRHKDIAIA